MTYLISVRIDEYPDGYTWKVFALISLVAFGLGVYLYIHARQPHRGFSINPKWVIYFSDFINLIIGILASFLVQNVILLKFQMPVIEDEDFSLFMGVYYFVLGIPIMAFFTNTMLGQIIRISSESIESDGFLNHQKLNWNEIQDIKLKDQYLPQGRVGIIIPRKLQKKMILKSEYGDELIINEPQTKKAKSKLYAHLVLHIPDRLKSMFEDQYAVWL
jgi:hypothetical protein